MHMVTLTSKSDGKNMDIKDWYGGRHLLDEPSPEQMRCSTILNKWNVTLSDGFRSCCANFILRGEYIALHPRELYRDLRNFLLAEKDDQLSGRFCFEFIVWQLFQEPTLSNSTEKFYELATSSLNNNLLIETKVANCKRQKVCNE